MTKKKTKTPQKKSSGGSKSRKKLSASKLKEYKNILLKLRERILQEISFLSDDSRAEHRDPSVSDQGSDNFEREFALNIASTEQDTLFEIDEALRRIESKTYGICEMSGDPIESERLHAMPFTRYSVKAQEELENKSNNHRS